MHDVKKTVGFVAGMALCLSVPVAYAANDIVVGVAVGLSGANSVVAPSVVQAADLAVDQINAAGGVLGRKLRLEIVDDSSSAAGAQKAYDVLVFQKKVDAIVSMETSAARNAALPIVTRGRIPFIYTSFYEGRSCNKYMYINAWVPEQQVAPMVDYFTRQKDAKTFFLIGSDYAFGRGMLAFTRKYIEKTGGKVVGEEYNPIDATDWTAIVSKIRAVHPDALMISTAGGVPNVTLTKQLRTGGIKALYGNLSIDEGTARSMGADAVGTYVAGSYYTSLQTPANQKFMAAMKARFGDKLETPNDLSVPEYDAVLAYAEAVAKAGSTATDKVIPALASVTVDGPRGAITMDKERHAALSMYLGQVMPDGSVKVISEFKNEDPGEQCPNLK
ncbi:MULTISPECIES: substrate-binding protein [Burkholderiaceae]|jgi:urea transport system substrate-binding protein|uniref:Extracellular ligand-binding receptor n=2 Tax=Burkholderiaceae TaxID=119060 RepID=B2SZC3_PARPJ|nr:Extracellular ligand-binding receptor [Paraburkholderia phytofirmans PsJN]ERJ39290.1 Urea ABC transporter, urea binding protein [Burkholderia sp. AU4i]MBA9947787.1 amino acid ABC transporter [Burkholderia cepacia]MBR8393992.1 substrate-binding protein [Burkholderia cenocepacia]MBY4816182.1 substrate-binding protein [Burkholderia contaminans]PZW91219.1 amino acid/amide ABC transporter substrate-binding protein (HAAT family) [Burkholderia sp. 28_3]HEP6277591.1 substrate-binding protein [Burk